MFLCKCQWDTWLVIGTLHLWVGPTSGEKKSITYKTGTGPSDSGNTRNGSFVLF